MANFPTALDVLNNPSPGTQLSDAALTHSAQHATINDIIEAVEAKLGIGSGAAAAGTVLRALGAGSSGWGKVATDDIVVNGITQLVALSDATALNLPGNAAWNYTGLTISLVGLVPSVSTIMLLWHCSVTNTLASQSCQFSVGVDATSPSVNAAGGLSAVAGGTVIATGMAILPAAAVNHAFNLLWFGTGGTISRYTSSTLLALELKR